MVAWLTCTVCWYFRLAILAVSLSVIPVYGTCDFLALRILRTQFVVAATVALCRLSPILDWATGDFSLQFVTQLCSRMTIPVGLLFLRRTRFLTSNSELGGVSAGILPLAAHSDHSGTC